MWIWFQVKEGKERDMSAWELSPTFLFGQHFVWSNMIVRSEIINRVHIEFILSNDFVCPNKCWSSKESTYLKIVQTWQRRFLRNRPLKQSDSSEIGECWLYVTTCNCWWMMHVLSWINYKVSFFIIFLLIDTVHNFRTSLFIDLKIIYQQICKKKYKI